MNDNLTPVHPIEARDRLEKLTGQRWSLERLGYEMGYTASAAWKWSNGERTPAKRTMIDAARLLAHYESKVLVEVA